MLWQDGKIPKPVLEIVVMNKPVKGKLTCKGKVGDQLAAVGVDHKKLHNTTIGGIKVDVSDLMEEAAQRVIDAVNENTNKNGVPFGEILDSENCNGIGYMDAWKAQMIEMASTALQGTAAQGWAFKNVVASANGFDVDLFNSQATATTDVDAETEFD
jgi:hypothetical protein